MDKFGFAMLALAVGVGVFLWLDSRRELGDNKLSDPYFKADAAFIAGEYAEAVSRYDEALELRPEDDDASNAYYRKAKSLDAMEKYDEAVKAYKAYIDQYPDGEHISQARSRRAYIQSLSGAGGV